MSTEIMKQASNDVFWMCVLLFCIGLLVGELLLEIHYPEPPKNLMLYQFIMLFLLSWRLGVRLDKYKDAENEIVHYLEQHKLQK